MHINSKISSFGIFILFVGTFLPQTESIPSIWSNVVVPRARRQTLSLTTDAATENATPSIEDGTQPEKSATDEKVNCDMLVEQIRPICKVIITSFNMKRRKQLLISQ